MAYKLNLTPNQKMVDIFNSLTPSITRSLPNTTDTYQAPVAGPIFQGAVAGPKYAGPVVPQKTTQAPVVVPQRTPTQQPQKGNIPPQYINPATGTLYSPEEFAAVVQKAVPGADVTQYAGNALANPNQTSAQLQKTAGNLNNARNDIAVGATDPYKVASQSGIAYSPAELSAIEKAYAGIYDPALQDVFIKLDAKQKEDAAKLEQKNKLEQMAKQHAYDVELKKTQSGGTAGTETNPNYDGEFAATIDQVANMESSVFGKKQVASQLQNLITNKDYKSAYGQIANTVENGLVGEAKQKYVNARTDYGVMEGLKKAIKAYADAGGNMGLLTGTEEQIKRKLGIDSGKASALATQLWREFQTYRNNMTGAAFGASESRDYASVNPTLGKSLDLNLNVIEGAQKQLENRITSTINQRIPSAQYILEYAQGAEKQPKTNVTSQPTTDFESWLKANNL